MKKLVLSMALVLISSIALGQNNIKDAFTQFEKKANVKSVEIGSFGMFFAKLLTGSNSDIPMVENTKSVQVLDFSGCSNPDKEELNNWVKQVDSKGYETLVRVKESQKSVYILALRDKDKIKEFLIIDTDNPVFIRLKGSFKNSDFQELASKYN